MSHELHLEKRSRITGETKTQKLSRKTYHTSRGILIFDTFRIKILLKSGNACCHLVQNLLSSSLLSKNIKISIHGAIILPLVLYGCETWSLTLREEGRLKVFQNRVLRRIFGPKRDKEIGECILVQQITKATKTITEIHPVKRILLTYVA